MKEILIIRIVTVEVRLRSEKSNTKSITSYPETIENLLAHYNLLAPQKISSKKFNEALPLLLKTAETYTDNFTKYESIALSYHQSGNNDEALKYFKKSYELNKNQPSIKSALETCYLLSSDFGKFLFVNKSEGNLKM